MNIFFNWKNFSIYKRTNKFYFIATTDHKFFNCKSWSKVFSSYLNWSLFFTEKNELAYFYPLYLFYRFLFSTYRSKVSCVKAILKRYPFPRQWSKYVGGNVEIRSVETTFRYFPFPRISSPLAPVSQLFHHDVLCMFHKDPARKCKNRSRQWIHEWMKQ